MVPSAIDHDYAFLKFVSDLEAGREQDLDRYALLEEHFLEDFFPADLPELLELFWGKEIATILADWSNRYFEVVRGDNYYRLEPILADSAKRIAWRILAKEAGDILERIDAYVPPEIVQVILGGNFIYLPLNGSTEDRAKGIWLSRTHNDLTALESYFPATEFLGDGLVFRDGRCTTQFGPSRASLTIRDSELQEVTLRLETPLCHELLRAVEEWIKEIRRDDSSVNLVARVGRESSDESRATIIFTPTR